MSVKINDSCLKRYYRLLENYSKSTYLSIETDTRQKLIDPLIECLGWDLLSNEVYLEYPVLYTRSKKPAVDYALINDGKPLVFIEAKEFSDLELIDSDIIKYDIVDSLKWLLLTNGRILKIFKTKSSTPLIVDLREPTNLEKLNFLHKESMIKGVTESVFDGILQNPNFKKLCIVDY